MKEELPELSLEEAKALFLKHANAGDFDKAVKVGLYYTLSKPDYEQRMNEAFDKALKEWLLKDYQEGQD